MKFSEKEALRKCRLRLCKELQNIEVLAQLEAAGVLAVTDRQFINAEKTQFQSNGKLLDILAVKGSEAFDCFLSALTESGQSNIASYLTQSRVETEECETSSSPTGNYELPMKYRDINGKTSEEQTNLLVDPSICMSDSQSKCICLTNYSTISFLQKHWCYVLAIALLTATAVAATTAVIVFKPFINRSELDEKNSPNDIMIKAAAVLKRHYREKLFTEDDEIAKIWVNVTLEQNGKMSTDYQALINRAFVDKDLLLIEGDAGTGKTHLLQKIVHDWAIGNFLQFKLVIYGSFKHLFNNANKTIVESVYGAIDSIDSSVKNAIAKSLQSDESHSVLLVLDGYDEVHPSMICEQLRKLLLLETETLQEAPPFKIIISSRTNYVEINRRSRFSHVKIIGFHSYDQKTEYIDKYFAITNNSDGIEELKLMLRSPQMDWSMNPHYMRLICLVSKQLKKGTELELFEQIVIRNMQRHGEKSPEYAKSIYAKCNVTIDDDPIEIKSLTIDQWKLCPYLLNLGRLAFSMLFGSKSAVLEFSKVQLKDFDVPTAIYQDFGLLAKEEKDFGIGYVYKFQHKSFQEFFAAFYCNSVPKKCFSESGKWYDYNATQNFNERFHSPTEFEYFLFRYAVANSELGDERMRPLLHKYITLKFSFSKADIQTGEQLRQFLAQLMNVTHLSLSGTLINGNINVPQMDKLRIISLDDISFLHQNQTILPLPMNKMINMESITYRSCPRSIYEWKEATRALLRSPRKLNVLRIHCTRWRWPKSDDDFLFEFLEETVSCSKKVKKLSIFKDRNDKWPPYNQNANNKMTNVLTSVLRQSNFEILEFTEHLSDYYSIDFRQFPSAKKHRRRERVTYSINISEHKANTTVRVNLSRWGIDTEKQLRHLLFNEYPNVTHLSIFGLLKKGNLTIPHLHKLISIKYSNVEFSNPAHQSIHFPSRDRQPMLRTIKFLSCHWSTKQWQYAVNSLANSSLALESLQISCQEWSTLVNELVTCTMSIMKLELFKNRNTYRHTDSESPSNNDRTLAVKKLAKSRNINTIVLNEEFVRFNAIDISQFLCYKFTSPSRLGKQPTYIIKNEASDSFGIFPNPINLSANITNITYSLIPHSSTIFFTVTNNCHNNSFNIYVVDTLGFVKGFWPKSTSIASQSTMTGEVDLFINGTNGRISDIKITVSPQNALWAENLKITVMVIIPTQPTKTTTPGTTSCSTILLTQPTTTEPPTEPTTTSHIAVWIWVLLAIGLLLIIIVAICCCRYRCGRYR